MKVASGIAVALALVGAGALAQAPGGVIVRMGFEDSEHGWTAMGGTSRQSVTQEPADVKAGKAALQFDYTIAPGDFCALMLPIMDGAVLAKAKSVKFWAKTDAPSPLAVIVQEKDGGRWAAGFSCPSGTWQRVELSWSDFMLGRDGGDPADANGRLDVDRIEGIGLADLTQVFAQAGPLAKLLGLKTGARKLLLDEFELNEIPLLDTQPGRGEMLLDAFDRPQVNWFVSGGAKSTIASGAPLNTRCLRLDYKQAREQISGIIRFTPKGKFDGTGKLAFTASANKAVTLVIMVEETTGGKYHAIVQIPGGEQVKDVAVQWSEFVRSPDSKDTNGQLDREQIKQLIIADLSVLMGGSEDITLWIGRVRVTTAS